MKKMTNVLLVSEDFIKTNSTLSDNYFGKYLTPAIVEAQDMGLQTILGSCLYNKILTIVEDGTIQDVENAAYKGLLDEVIQPYLLYKVLSNSVFYANIKLANMGTVVTNDEHIVNLTQKDIDLIEHNFVNKCDFYARRLQEYLLNNSSSFPELDICACEQIKANLKSAENCGIWLGGYQGK